MKTLTLILAALILMTASASAAIAKSDGVAVMDFGTHPRAVTIDINILNAGKAAHEYILQRIVESQKVDVVDRYTMEAAIKAYNLYTEGIIDPDTASKIGEMLGVRYIVYGNVNDVTLSEVGTKIGIGGVTVCTVKAHIIARVMDVETGEIISAAKGEGKSKSSFVKVEGGPVAVVEVGSVRVTQDSVHNAIQKAAYQTVDILIRKLFD
ncbi:MAG: hypothetical protein J5809_05780 [Selenomonadaceae bacterium]|nr:hypothetical protein [Selenomonadaceae bacterium]